MEPPPPPPREVLEGEGKVWDPKLCVPKMARQDCPDWKSRFFPSFVSLVKRGGFGLVWVKACAGRPGPWSALAFVPTRLG